MKVVILAGGFGTRISEESHLRPKPMIEIGERPILWHIMKIYSHYGYNEFIICLGYKGNFIKDYFAHYLAYESDVTFDFAKNEQIIHNRNSEAWRVTLVDTGLQTMTGGRLKRIKSFIGDEPFMLTYGDGVSNINIRSLVEFHRSHGKLATVTSTQPIGKFGSLVLDQDRVENFLEKPKNHDTWINSGFFVMQPEVINYIEGDQTVLEKEPLENLAVSGQLMAYKHKEFWQCMDTIRDRNLLEDLWVNGQAPWKVWA